MPPNRDPISLTLTVHLEPPLDETATPATGDEIAARLGVEHAVSSHGTGDDAGWASWTLVVPNDRTIGAWTAAATDALHAAIPAGHTVRIDGLELVAMGEVSRRLASRGSLRPLSPADADRARAAITEVPEVVTTAQFAELLGVTPARVRKLRQDQRGVGTPGGFHPFPQEVLPGYWRRDEAQAYADAGPRPAGRPRRA